MEPIINIQAVSKEFRVLNRREGLKGTFLDLFSRNYKTVTAVNEVSLDILPGEMVGYLGPNGAGKSTTIKMMTGVLKPTQGKILVNGRIPYENRTVNAQNIGVVFGQRTQLWWALPLIESFRILKEIYQIDDAAYKENLELFDDLVAVSELYSKPVRQMSLGQRTLCDILASFLHNPSIVFLDEPTIGLDVAMKAKVRKLVSSLNKEKNTTVILTTHDMGDVEALCKRIIIIDKGTMIYDNSIENLKSFFGNYRTLKVIFKENETVPQLNASEETLTWVENKLSTYFKGKHKMPITLNEGWIDILVNEEEVSLIEVFNYIQTQREVKHVKMEEISTEDVIKKIYEGGVL